MRFGNLKDEEINKGGSYWYKPKRTIYTYIDDKGNRRGKSVYATVDGEPCLRMPQDYPYSYSRFCIYDAGFKDTDSVVWTDRLRNEENHNEIFSEVLGHGQYYSHKRPEKIEEFLQKLFGKPDIMLTAIEEECNFSNGYPYWLLYFRRREDGD